MNKTFILFFFLPLNLLSQNDSISINKNKLNLVYAGTAATLGISYLFLQNSWWIDNKSTFHFDDGSDLRYALNVDKAGHFFGGVLVSDVFQHSLQWSGVDEKKSYIYGAAMGTFVQLGIEMKDAYAPNWGFSKWDLISGSFGSLVPLSKRYLKPMKYIDFKLSYYKKSDQYWIIGEQQKPQSPPGKYDYHNDYVNQTYWVSIFPFRDKGHLIGFSLGFGLNDQQFLDSFNTKRGGSNEYYLALDYDLLQILKNWNTPSAKKIKHWLNYFKLPAPTIRISPNIEFFPFFL